MTDIAAGSTPLASVRERGRPGVARRFMRRRSFVVGMAGLVAVIGMAVLAPVLTPHDPLRQDLMATLRPPVWAEGGGWVHPLGTDALGRDVLSRLLHGARNSLVIAVFAVLIAASLGSLAGLSAGFSRGWWDALLMRLGDMQLAFPFILLAIIVLGVSSDRTPIHIILVLGIPGWILYARVVRSRVLAERDKDYVTAARAIGASRLRQLRRYVLPSVWQVVLVIALLDLGFVILVESTLSFLGFGLTPPTPSWGSILADGRRNMSIAPWLAVIPGFAIMVTVLAVNLTADGIADVLDPKLRKGTFRRIRQAVTRAPLRSSVSVLRSRAGAAQAPSAPVASRETAGSTSSWAGTTPSSSALPVLGLRAPADLGSRTPEGRGWRAPNLRVEDLHVEFPFDEQVIRAVRGVDLEVARGQTLGIVGESGSGKSVTALAIMQLLDAPGRVTEGAILFEGQDLTRIDDRTMAGLRGTKLGMIFQNPAGSLNPVMTVGAQIIETMQAHPGSAGGDVRERARAALVDVGIGDPDRVMSRYPFQLSGGMNQRVMIAMAMLVRPDLLIADEPTTALDVTTQAQVLEQLVAITQEHDTALVLISHDIALVAEYVDDVVVMYAGRVAERGPVEEVIASPRHPYTRALLDSVPRADLRPDERLTAIPGELPDPSVPVTGCPFAERCPYVMDVCRRIDPPLEPVAPDRRAACHLPGLPAREAQG